MKKVFPFIRCYLFVVCLVFSNLCSSVKCQRITENGINKNLSILYKSEELSNFFPGCKKIDWFNWQKIASYKYQGTSIYGDKATFNADPSSLFQGLFNLELNDNSFQPKIVPQMPTPFMPGNSTKVLTHRIALDKVTYIDSLYFFIASVPNSDNGFQGPQYLKIRVYDKANNLVDISNMRLLFRDPSIYGLSSTDVKFSPFEIQMMVSNNGSLADGDALIFNGFPKNSYYIEIEHNDDKSFTWDGVFINLGLPVCCSPFSLISKDTTICEGSSITLQSPEDSSLWSNGVLGKEIVVNSAGWYWAEIKNLCGTFRDSININFKVCSSPCTLTCDTIKWVDWVQKTKTSFTAISKDFGSVSLNLDLRTGTINPILNNLNLNNNIYFPKFVSRVPTPWMPGIPNITKLIHQILTDKITSKKDLLVLVGNFPNERKYNSPQTGKLRALDKNGIKLDITNVCLVFSDNTGGASPSKITRLTDEILFKVDDMSTADGEVSIFNNFPDDTYIIEIEHNNSISYTADGIYLTVGFPSCCMIDTSKIDTTVCDFLDFNGIRITQSGKYYMTIKRADCDSVVELNTHIEVQKSFQLPNDTTLCFGNSIVLISD
ncbi:MAG: hypothetical protein ABIO44_14035, partial [Saprospiraceae bacterium]